MNYGFRTEVNLEFEKAVKIVKENLEKEGFGVLTEINVKDTLKNKLNVDYSEYVILGVCNPPFAYNALQAEKEIGLFLPCNLIVYVLNKKTIISIIDPVKLMNLIKNKELKKITKKVKNKLRNVLNLVKNYREVKIK
ncbi:ABC transporter ATP-binding protein [Candidatus Pacearchaeota archaeon CG09_land_8_20_14_0_10_30_9]|nr:MAG: ABC transporter ATP-binding protein [Candidatus Pacearchaeota archaeon CG1_02_30_18]PIN71231.1 MAG: ABC transporter ATP-binding protein [Candidatus Pacearchaeota archaeon CG11_big_fil_rev_8_21_14_0_20_30_13]PIO01201.1 MAG: ABC transporter ATP-binding protein [Candidatus Pacearchaeota archaeon CG09_land_8_20_14_0_10_30_9]PIZ81923.1 MAG: ABC transporter ATP-binding protein [Candidatus Pacearchaeota archaeon CG_4_10_14_0_2_um_filter_30_11]PJA71368.1 MAG: ABC transporter ATP-binding protein